MFDQLATDVAGYLQSNPALAVGAVFLGGALTASSPCVLVMIPLTIGFVAGRKPDGGGGALRAFGFSSVLVLGMAVTFTAMGMGAALAGRLYGEVPRWFGFVVAGVCLVMGLHLMGLLRLAIPVPSALQPKITGLPGAFVLGLLFGVVSAPCAAPILVVLLTYLAGSGASVPFGGLLLLTYALGHGVLVLAAGTSMGAARRLIESKKLARATDLMRRGAGVVILLAGAFFAWRAL